MEIKEFISTLEKSKFSLAIENEKIILKGDKDKLTKEEVASIKTNDFVINYIKENKNELIKYLSLLAEGHHSKFHSKNITAIYRLSGLQQGILFHGLFDEGTGAYVIQLSCDLIGPDLVVFNKSWDHVITKHSILRSAFYHDSFNVPVQSVYKNVELPVELLDYQYMTVDQQAIAIKQYTQEDRRKGFDFKSAPVMRISLIRISEDRYHMLWTWHHILFDGWSTAVLMEELLSTYDLIVAGKEIHLGEEDRFEDYIHYIERRNKEQEEKYWNNYLKSIGHSTLLPFIKSTADRNKGIGIYKTIFLKINASTTEQIDKYTQRNRITSNSVMQGVWAYLLHRYTASSNVIFGVTVSGRPDDLPGVEHRVGMYINTLPVITTLNEDQNIVEWIKSIQEDQVSSRKFQYTNLQDIQSWSGVQGNLFDSTLTFQNFPVGNLLSSRQWGLKIENVYTQEQNNYPLSITIDSAEEISIQFKYNSDLLEKAYVEEISSNFENILFQIVSNPGGCISNIKLLTNEQEQRLLVEFNNTAVAYPKHKTIIDLFQEQVDKAPEAVALLFEDKTITFGELNNRSNQVAHYLKSRGIKNDSLIPICVERSPEMLIGVIGILKSGAAYVPIDPDYPIERISYMIEDSRASIVLSSGRCKSKLQTIDEFNIILLDDSDSAIVKQQKENLKTVITGNQLAYVIYTSGSTGKPKGVMIEHNSLLNYLVNSKTKYIDEESNHTGSLMHLSYTFDASLTAMFMPLLSGKSVVIASAKFVNVFEDNNLLKYAPYHFIKVTPSHLPLLEFIDLNKNGQWLTKKLVVGGEALHLNHFKYLLNKGIDVEIINEYGPTEATVGCSTYSVKTLDEKTHGKNEIPIGTPIDNLEFYILNERFQLSPIGVQGEIYVAGAGLAKGYLNLEKLTAEKFIPNPFSAIPGSKLYKTGDLGHWLPDGKIEYLGRIDDQVKIRGYRIELGEIEGLLQKCELIKQAVVLAKEDKNENKRLVAYVVPDPEFDKDEVITYLTEYLPEYMIPSLWVKLEHFPLTTNGKIDKKALPDPDAGELLNNQYVKPRYELEIKMAHIWEEVLAVERVGIYDNFFNLGGNSLLAIRLISFIRRELKFELTLTTFFELPTIEQLANYIKIAQSDNQLKFENYDTIKL